MKLIELHILQSFPVSCLNRDDVGAPKTAIFGGATRARISSQCLKRAIRELARKGETERDKRLFAGSRTLKAAENLTAELVGLGLAEKEAGEVAQAVCRTLLSKPKKAPSKEEAKTAGKKSRDSEPHEGAEEADTETSTLLYFSPGEIAAMAKAIVDARSTGKDIQKAASKAAKDYGLKDAADIAIFGRMVANDATLNVEGAGMFSHAISTHACDNDLDFWTAVDDAKGPDEDPGAANMGHAEFNAACYYRYAALNLDLLFYQKNGGGKPTATLGWLAGEENRSTRRAIVEAFLRAVIFAVPPAKHTGMNADLPPEYVLGVAATGQPMQLANAFEAPVRANGQGWLSPSIKALESHYERLKRIFELEPAIGKDGELRLCERTPLNTFIARLVAHVE